MRVGLKPQPPGLIKGARLSDTVAQALHNITLAVRVSQRRITTLLLARFVRGAYRGDRSSELRQCPRVVLSTVGRAASCRVLDFILSVLLYGR